VLVLGLLVVVGGFLAVVGVLGTGSDDGSGSGGLHGAFDDMIGERYAADLTQGHGDFTVVEDASSSSSYGPEGYVLVAKDDVPALRGVQTNGSHTSLGVRITTQSSTPQGTFAFGPFCWRDPDAGFGFMVSNNGRAMLVEPSRSEDGTFRIVRSTPVEPIDWSRWHELRIDCSVQSMGGNGTVALRGFVDGRRVVRGTSTVRADVLGSTGFGGVNTAPTPATWVVRSFNRLGADDVGPNP
jgi:hypothetical protein